MNRLAGALLGGLVFLAGCTQPATEPQPTASSVAVTSPSPAQAVPASPLGDFADKAVRKRARLVLAGHTGKSFKTRVSGDRENAKAFLYLAATSTDDQVAGDALKALKFTFGSNPEADSREFAGDFYAPVVLHHLKGKNKDLVVKALGSAAPALGKNPNPELLDEIIRLGTEDSDVEVRSAAVSALASYGGRDENPKIQELWLKAYQDEPLVAARALQWSRGKLASGDNREQVMSTFTELSKHEDPLVRGLSAYAAGSAYSSDPDFVLGLAEPLLKDSSPFVRAQALSALGELRDKRVFPLLASLLDDKAGTELVVEYMAVTGSMKKEKFTTFGHGRVDGTAIKEIGTASFLMMDKEQKFNSGKVGFQTKDEDIARDVKAAKAWFAKHQDAIANL